jgi:integrase
MASIHRDSRSKFYQCAFTDSDGKRVFKSTKQTDKTEAWRVAIALEDSAKMARDGRITAAQMRKVIAESVSKITGEKPHLHTIADWCREWAADKKLSRSEGTAKRYGPMIEEFLKHLGTKADRDISHLSMTDVRSFRDKKLKSGLANASVNIAIKVLRSCFKLAVRQEMMTSNPADAVDLLPKAGKMKQAFTREQVAKILGATNDVEWKGLIKVGYFVGARLQNCARLRFEEIDFDQRLLEYTPIKQRVGREPKVITIPLHEELYDYLVVNRKPSGPIFPRLSKTRIEGKTGLSLRFRELLDKAGIKYGVKKPTGNKGRKVYSLGFHSLRHAFNSDLANSGVSQEIRQRLIGHASEAVNDGYTSLELKTFASAISKLQRLEPSTASTPASASPAAQFPRKP